MAKTIIIAFHIPTDTAAADALIHRVRNFGEDLFRNFEKSGLASLSLAEIDRATDQILVHGIKARSKGDVLATIESQLKRHKLFEFAAFQK